MSGQATGFRAESRRWAATSWIAQWKPQNIQQPTAECRRGRRCRAEGHFDIGHSLLDILRFYHLIQRRSSGFTVIELVGVLAILAILLASIVGAYLGWGQAGALDGAANMVVSSLARARELAITRRDTTGMACGNTAIPGHAARGFFVLFTNSVEQAISPTNYLPGDVQFVLDEGGQQSILFTTEGRALPRDADAGTAFVGLVSPRGGRPLHRYIDVDTLTGIASVLQVTQ